MRYYIFFAVFFLTSPVFAAPPQCTNTWFTGCYNSLTMSNLDACSGGSHFADSAVPQTCGPYGGQPQTTFVCRYNCTCPPGTELDNVQGCVSPENQCPEGQAMVSIDGQQKCFICMFGVTNGQCNQNEPPDTCPSDQTLQGYVNGFPVCHGHCEGAQSWGSVNGVEGCYGSPACAGGYTYGTINGTSGCWPEMTCDSLGQCATSSSGSNTSSGSNNSAGSNTSTGSNTSSGTGGNGSGDNGSGGNSGGGSGGSNNPGYVNPEGLDECPIGMHLGADRVCRTPDNDVECHLPNYHYVLTNPSTGAGACVPDTPQSSSSSQPSSAQQSSAAASVSSQHSSINSGGSGGSAGSGSGSSAGSGSNTSAGAGECDPTAKNYLECISSEPDLDAAEQKTQDVKVQLQDQVNDGFDYVGEQFSQDVQSQVQQGVPFKNEPSALQSALMAYLPQPVACTDISIALPREHHLVIKCDYFETFKLIFGWFLSVIAAMYIWSMATAPVDR